MITSYDNIVKRDKTIKENNTVKDEILINFIKNPMVEIKGFSNRKYNVQFIDVDANATVYSVDLSPNCWGKCTRQWYTNWLIRITDNSGNIAEHKFDAGGKRVYIHLDSKSLGDTLAWFPYVEEFRKKHNCIVICSTFWNDLFKDNYKDIRFVPPGSQVNNLYAMFEVGWFSNTDRNKNKVDPRLRSLQEIACDCLGIEYKEIIPNIVVKNNQRQIKEKYVCIATASTAQAKYWNNPTGWQQVIDYLNSIGYKVVIIQTEETELKNAIIKTGKRDIQDTINYLLHSDFVMGISSGIPWVGWALRKPTIIISGFTKPLTEYKTNLYRIFNESVCNGCMNDSAHVFDKGDWNWCPRLKGTDRQFECSKQISFKQVKVAIDSMISNDLKSLFYYNCIDGKQRKLNAYNLTKNFNWDKWRAHQYESGDLSTYFEIFIEHVYEHGDWVKIKPNDVVIDIGANIGSFTRYAHEMGASKIYAYEPEMKNYQCLVKNLPENSRAENVAVSAVRGLVKLFIDSYAGGHSLIDTNVNSSRTNNTQQIQSITLNSILDSIEKIDFIKVDTEGAEWSIFESCNFLKLSKVRNIVVEYHNMLFNFDDNKRSEFIKKFTDIGYNYYLNFCDSTNHLQMMYFWK